MNSETTRALERINRVFYERHADEFHRTRGAPWPGWRRVAELLEESEPGRHGDVPAVLDAGCGNGRFALFLRQRLGRPFRYLGVDSSAPLLAIARRRIPADLDAELARLELLSEPPGSELPAAEFDLVAAFGLFHHVPSARKRRRLLEALARSVAEGGLLAVSFWQFIDGPGFERRVLPWSSAAAAAGRPIASHEVEPGDHLLAWGDRGDAVRYCHQVDREEAERMHERVDLAPVTRFRADGRDGRSNLYFVSRREPERPAP